MSTATPSSAVADPYKLAISLPKDITFGGGCGAPKTRFRVSAELFLAHAKESEGVFGIHDLC